MIVFLGVLTVGFIYEWKRERSNGNDRALVAPVPRGILDPRTGKPIGADDPNFGESTTNSPTRAFWSPRPTI